MRITNIHKLLQLQNFCRYSILMPALQSTLSLIFRVCLIGHLLVVQRSVITVLDSSSVHLEAKIFRSQSTWNASLVWSLFFFDVVLYWIVIFIFVVRHACLELCKQELGLLVWCRPQCRPQCEGVRFPDRRACSEPWDKLGSPSPS